jgi:hypothetical protein
MTDKDETFMKPLLACNRRTAFNRSRRLAQILSGSIPRTEGCAADQMRSEIRSGGPGEGETISAVWRSKTFLMKELSTSSIAVGGGAMATVALNRASGEWLPSQHFCSGLGEEGADSWQPESIGAVSGVTPMVQEACNNRAAIAANTATRPLSRNINLNTFITPIEACLQF